MFASRLERISGRPRAARRLRRGAAADSNANTPRAETGQPARITSTKVVIDPDRVYWIDPNTLTHATRVEFSIHKYSGRTVAGAWDLNPIPFNEGVDFHACYLDRIENHTLWEETAFYKRVAQQIEQGTIKCGCSTEKEFRQRCEGLDMLFQDMKQNGYSRDPDRDYVAVNVGREGRVLFNNGRHRVVFAKILNIPRIPIKITVRHPKWIKFKKEILKYALRQGGYVYAPLSHLDLRDVPCGKARTGWRFERIAEHIHPRSKTVLDIGAHWGYMCGKLEEIGRECTAVENGKKASYFLERLKIAGKYTYKTVQADIVEFVRKNNQYDVALALAIFHHFLKQRDSFDNLKELLRLLDIKEMFFQSQHPGEGQMKDAYRNFQQDEFAQFIVDHSCLNRWKEIGAYEGRRLYHLTR